MTKEEVRKELNEATKLQKEATRVVNEALCHAAGQLGKDGSESFETGYEKGLEDCWEMMKKLDKMCWETRHSALGLLYSQTDSLSATLTNITPQIALERLTEYEKKKAEEEAKPKIGDVVYVTGKHSGKVWKGIFIDGNTHTGMISIATRDSLNNIYRFQKNNITIEKTGEHVDILGALKE